MFHSDRKLIAILRGVEPSEVIEIGEALVEGGINWIEVPLNSPDPYKSIESLVKKLEAVAQIGAGTVISVDEVNSVLQSGGKFVVSPNCNRVVIESTKSAGLKSCPGIFTPTEAFDAISAGADILKLFPASILGLEGINAIKAVLPSDVQIFAVGGVDTRNMEEYFKSGISGLGLGSSLYSRGDNASLVLERAKQFSAIYDQIGR